MNIEVEKKDILNIGYKRINFAGVLGIVSDSDTANVEEILLRCILKCFGETYIITKVEDCVMVDEDDLYDDIMFITNLPYEVYQKIENS